MRRSKPALPLAVTLLTAMVSIPMANAQSPKKITTIEGITEFKLDNGLQVLLFPDDSNPTVTVNLTMFVGSRHEGYGEAGMAHLLEHMLFKGTPLHPNVPKALQDRGARFNGTTWVDRTNYYETLPASEENLEFAIRLEADRMVNSFIRGSDLASEMTVVRNEFERGENSPSRVLMQRMYAAAYEWHNYGKSTIGNRSDIERVPIENLQKFYRKHYQPDNAMLVVAGKFDEEKALEFINKYFGVLESPERAKDSTYTEEPAQDGERTVALRRVGDIAIVAAAYHIPSGAHPDFAAIRVLSNILGTEPSGRLYRALVETKKASAVSTYAFAYHDPGLIMMDAELPKDGPIEEVRQIFLSTMEEIGEKGVTDKEVERAKSEILAERELAVNNTTGIAVSLSDWAAQGDWRLFFLYRDRIEKVTNADVQRVAKQFLARNNRTVGLFIPTEEAQRIAVPATPSIKDMVEGYQGREQVAEGENFDPSPENIDARTTHAETGAGMQVALLPKKTKGESVVIDVSLRFGDAETLQGKVTAAEFLPELMTRGTKEMSYEDLQDALTANRIKLSASGQRGLASFSMQTKRGNLPEAIKLLKQILREPSLPEDQFEVLKRETLSGLEQGLNDPQALAVRKLRQTVSPFPKDDVRYNPTIEEEIGMVKDTSLSTVNQLYADFIGSQAGEVSVVGDFDPAEIKPLLDDVFAKWQAKNPYKRIPEDADVSVTGSSVSIETPDKANAFYISSVMFPLKDNDELYPGLVMGNFILGGGSLSSRLGDRVRQKEGLSYGVRSIANAHPIDDRGSLMIYAITNPQNRDKLVSVINEEVTRMLRDGVTEEELARAKDGYLQSLSVSRTDDGYLARMLSSNMFAGRTMKYHADHEQQVRSLGVGDVKTAMDRLVDLSRLTTVTAGDFKNAEKESGEEAKKE